MNFHPRRSEEPELNLTSLIDVVLLLLIFFMLSTRFIDEGRLQLRLPEAGAEPEAVRAETVEIEVTGAGRLPRQRARARQQQSRDAARRRSAAPRAATAAVPVTIRADARATHQSVVTAMDVAGRAGYRQINIATVHDGQAGR